MNDACDESTHTANRMGIVNLQMSTNFSADPGRQTFPRLTEQLRSRGTNLSFVCFGDYESMLRRRAGRLLLLWLPGYQPDLPLQKRPFVLVHGALDAVMLLAMDQRKQPDNDVGTGWNSGRRGDNALA
jgi:hypothetical protein